MKTIAQILIDDLVEQFKSPPVQKTFPKKVLVVDDDIYYAQSVKEYLTSEGYEVNVALEPGEAIRSIEATLPYSCVLLDMNFPGHQNGVKTLGQLREIYPKLKAVIVSGVIEQDFEHMAKSYGITVLSKGMFDFGDLKKIIECDDHQKPSGS